MVEQNCAQFYRQVYQDKRRVLVSFFLLNDISVSLNCKNVFR